MMLYIKAKLGLNFNLQTQTLLDWPLASKYQLEFYQHASSKEERHIEKSSRFTISASLLAIAVTKRT